MYKHHLPAVVLTALWAATSLLVIGQPAQAQPVPQLPTPQQVAGQPVHFIVNGPTQRLDMIVNTSRILTLEYKVPRLLVSNPEVVRATPLSPNQVQLSALKPGVTQLNLWDENQEVYSVDVIVSGDARELSNLLKAEFPDAALNVRPLASSVIISGYVPSAPMVGQIVRVAEDYYPNVINNMRVAGVQTVLLHTKVMEVSRTKLRTLGVDWAWFNGNDGLVVGASGLINKYTISPGTVTTGFNETLAFGIVGGSSKFGAFLEALRQHNMVKLLAEPTLVTTSGRPASFSSGGEFPIIVPQSLGTVSVEYRQFGTRVDFVPIVLGNGSLRLEVRPSVSEIDPSRSVNIQNVSVPGLRTRWVDTAVEMKAGQTLALAGLIQTRVEAENKGIPVLADLPWVGAAFRRVEEKNNEVELVILVTPEIVDAMDPHEVPPCGPGQLTDEPNNHDLYMRGFIEVPHCGPGCGGATQGPLGPQGPVMPYEEVSPGQAVPGGIETLPAQPQSPRQYLQHQPQAPAQQAFRPLGYEQPWRLPPTTEDARSNGSAYSVGQNVSNRRIERIPPVTEATEVRANDPRNPDRLYAPYRDQGQVQEPILMGPTGYDPIR